MSAVTFDACVMQRYTEALISGAKSSIIVLIDCVVESHSFAMDMGGKMQHQWLETCGSAVFGELFYKWLREGKILLFSDTMSTQHKKHLRVNCGFPLNTRHEGVFVAVAKHAAPHILVGEDLDFWEPSEKGCPSERRTMLMSEKKGSVCNYLRQKMKVRVLTIEQALLELCPSE